MEGGEVGWIIKLRLRKERRARNGVREKTREREKRTRERETRPERT